MRHQSKLSELELQQITMQKLECCYNSYKCGTSDDDGGDVHLQQQ